MDPARRFSAMNHNAVSAWGLFFFEIALVNIFVVAAILLFLTISSFLVLFPLILNLTLNSAMPFPITRISTVYQRAKLYRSLADDPESRQ